VIKENEVVCEAANLASPPPESSPTSIPIIAMEETLPGRYWVLVNFPGRTSLTLTSNADRKLAIAVMDAARTVCREALAYAASQQEEAL